MRSAQPSGSAFMLLMQSPSMTRSSASFRSSLKLVIARPNHPQAGKVIRADSHVKSLGESKRYDLSHRLLWIQHIVDRCERTAVMQAGAVGFEAFVVLRRAVTLVVAPVVIGVFVVQRAHHPVTRDLGNDRGRGDGDGARIALDQRIA